MASLKHLKVVEIKADYNMNPFVNPKKRGFKLPKGCKDLMDVLKRMESKQDGAIRQYIHMILFQAQQDQATDLVIGAASSDAGTPIRYKIEDVWYDFAPFPSSIRPDVLSELTSMAKFPEGQICGEGILEEKFGDLRSRWTMMISKNGECLLNRVND
jgi:hypothetical protein